MLRVKPRVRYNGITLILSNPSRHDNTSLLTADGGVLMNDCLRPEYNIMGCDIRLMEDKSDWLPNTKAIICLGEFAMKEYFIEGRSNTLNEMRGSPFYINNIPAIATFFPQDAVDYTKAKKNLEHLYNKNSKEYIGDNEDEHEEDDETGDVKRHSNTKGTNYYFWINKDVGKVKRILSSQDGKWILEPQPSYRIFPNAETAIDILSQTTDHFMYWDTETDIEEQNLLCFSFMFWKEGDENYTVYSIPVLDFNYNFAYPNLAHIIRALSVAIWNNTVVAWNGAQFDFLVFGYKYHIPFRKVIDPMIVQHRIYPDAEKSLGHAISLWTNQTYHKDEDAIAYRTRDQMFDRLKYCGKDVFGMFLAHQAQMKFAKTIPGLEASIDVATKSILPYLTTTLQGISFDDDKRQAICDENDILMEQYIRIINMLIGPVGLAACRATTKSKHKSAVASSNKQCVNYFHEQLDYDVIRRSAKTKEPSLGAKNMFKLALKYNNPVITFIILYRGVAKEYGSLLFNPWKDDNGKLFPRRKEVVE